MEALGGDQLWFDRFVAEHSALTYYWVLILMYLFSPKDAYAFSELVEWHATGGEEGQPCLQAVASGREQPLCDTLCAQVLMAMVFQLPRSVSNVSHLVSPSASLLIIFFSILHPSSEKPVMWWLQSSGIFWMSTTGVLAMMILITSSLAIAFNSQGLHTLLRWTAA